MKKEFSSAFVLLGLCACFAGGVAASLIAHAHGFAEQGREIIASQLWMLAGFVFFFSLLLWGRKRWGWILIVYGILAFAGGVSLYQIQSARRDAMGEGVLAQQDVSFEARVAQEPLAKQKNTQIVVRPEGEEYLILLYGDSFSRVEYADKLRISGNVELPPVFEDFDYASYLRGHGVYAVMYYPDIAVMESKQYQSWGEATKGAMIEIKQHLRDIVERTMPAQESSVFEGMMFGDSGQLSAQTKEELNASGLRHIIAISGMHIALLIVMSMRFFLWVGLWRQQVFFVTLVLAILFIVFTGFQPSAVRAGVMGAMLLLGQQAGRLYVAERALLLSAAGMLLVDPLLIGDAGFQLSFGAVWGILWFMPLLERWTAKIPNFLHLKEVLNMSIAAQIATLPIMVLSFGSVSFVSLLANILVVPMVPAIMVGGLVALVLSLLGSFVQSFIFVPVTLLLSYMLQIAEWTSGFPFAWVSFHQNAIWWLMAFLFPFVLRAWKERRKSLFPFG